MSDRLEHIDQFESMFRRADREPYAPADPALEAISLVTDADAERADRTCSAVAAFLPRVDSVSWRITTGGEFDNVNALLERIDRERPGLIVTQRHLHEQSLIPRHSLGVYLDVLTQASTIPVLVLPQTSGSAVPLEGRICRTVMVVTDHLAGDGRLVDWGVRMCPAGGLVWLCHIEDDQVFDRYVRAIGQIPDLNTEATRDLLAEQLLNDARDYVATCTAELGSHGVDVNVQSHVEFGHHVSHYRRLLDEHSADLLVMNTKDEDQLAMHGLAWALAVEFTDVPLLLL